MRVQMCRVRDNIIRATILLRALHRTGMMIVVAEQCSACRFAKYEARLRSCKLKFAIEELGEYAFDCSLPENGRSRACAATSVSRFYSMCL
jgi:hypothetical protein